LEYLVHNLATIGSAVSICATLVTAAYKVVRESVMLRESVNGLLLAVTELRDELAHERERREAADAALHRRIDGALLVRREEH
jgi:hypothetical protein